MKTNYFKKLSTVALATTTLSIMVGCNETKKTEFSVTPTTTTIAYTKDGDPVDPLDLVAIDRVEETDETTETASPTPSASASSEDKTEDTDKEEKSDDENAEKEADNTTEDEEKIELAEKAYVADGIEVEKVYPGVIDTSVVGDVTVLFTLKDTENNDSTSEVSVTFTVVDETAPAFKLTKTEDTVTVGAEFDAKSYVKDAAGCEYVDEAPEDSSKYENGWYTITSNVSTKKAGTYTVKYHAENSSGVATAVTLKITVKEAETASTENKSEKKAESKKQSSNKSSNQSATTNNNTVNNSSSSSNDSGDWTNGAGTDSYNGVIQTEGCNKTLVHHDALYKDVTETTRVWVTDQEGSVEEWYRCPTCNAEFSTYDAAMSHITNSSTCGNFVNFLKTTEEKGHYEDQTTTRQELICPAYDEYVCQ